jgi:ABC-type sugar transport system permease subunit/ABC-type glycerol-3-phosphate transport system substrate-binding protein
MKTWAWLGVLLWGISAPAATIPAATPVATPVATPAATPTAVAQEPITLRVMTHERWFRGFEYMEQVTAEFEAAHPGVKVELISSSGGSGSRDKIRFALAGDLPIDVTWIDVTEFSSFLDEQVLIDLQPYFDQDPDWQEQLYYQQILEGMRGPNGHLYGLPSTFNPYVMYVNKSLLAREGISMPADDWTWQQMVDISRKVTRDLDGDGTSDQYGISITQWLQALTPWIWQNGGRLLDTKQRVALDEPAAIEAIAFLQNLLHGEKIASDDATFANQLSVGLFQAGKVAFYGPVGFWETYRFREIEDFEWDYHPLPRGKQAATAVAMRFYCVPRTARHPQLAYEYVRALAGPTMQRGLAAIGNGVPGLISAAESEVFVDPKTPQREEIFLQVLPGARFLPVDVNWSEIQEQSGAVLEEAILLNRISAAEACQLATQIANASLDRQELVRNSPRLPRFWFPTAQFGAAAIFGLIFLRRWWRRSPTTTPTTTPAAANTAAETRSRSAGSQSRKTREEKQAWIFLAPWAIGFLFLLAGPAIVSLLLSFSEWSPVQNLDEARWMGLQQYQRLLHDQTFHTSLRVTTLYAVVAVPLQLITALALALLLNRKFRGRSVARTLFYLPTVVSPVILGAMWRWMLDADRGLLNQGLGAVGLQGPEWLKDPSWIIPSFILMSLWTVGAQMLVFLAGLQSLDPRLIEAAKLDGARSWSRFRHVILPALSPVLLFNLIVGLIQAFQIFAQPFVMTQGGPGNESRFLVLYLYEQGFRYLRMGYASTLAWVLFAMVAVCSLVILQSSKSWVHYAGRRK